MGFAHNEDIYKSASEGHLPLLLEFVRNFKTMGFQDLGPVQ